MNTPANTYTAETPMSKFVALVGQGHVFQRDSEIVRRAYVSEQILRNWKQMQIMKPLKHSPVNPAVPGEQWRLGKIGGIAELGEAMMLDPQHFVTRPTEDWPEHGPLLQEQIAYDLVSWIH